MIDVTQMAHVADAIDRLNHSGTNWGETSADFAEALITDYPTVQAAVVSYLGSKITRDEFDTVVAIAIQVDGELSLPLARELDVCRIAEYVKIITAFVTAYRDIDQIEHPRKLSATEAIEWFIQHDTKLQAESAGTINVVKRLVTERVTP